MTTSAEAPLIGENAACAGPHDVYRVLERAETNQLTQTPDTERTRKFHHRKMTYCSVK